MPRRRFPEQFRRDAVELVRSAGRSCRDVGRELDVHPETLRLWVVAADKAEARARGELTADEQTELRLLRAKVAELEVEKEILRKAAAYFAKEMGR
jgi:transposase